MHKEYLKWVERPSIFFTRKFASQEERIKEERDGHLFLTVQLSTIIVCVPLPTASSKGEKKRVN